MKTRALLLAAVAVCLSITSFAATVGPAGYSNDFGTQPPGTDWATSSRAGGAGDNYDVDVDVTNITATAVSAQPGPATGTPPAAAATAVWHSTAFYLQTRP